MSEKVLIVDDEPHIVTSLRFLMQQAGLEIITCDDGLIALDVIRKQRPQLVLLDVMLPTMDGLQVLKALRDDPDTCHIKIIMLTAKGRADDIEQGMNAGADLYITKPFSTRSLMNDVRKLLEDIA